jgi:hypothetical protein
MLSPYCKQLSEKLDMKTGRAEKLVPNLRDKKHYTLHYRNLKLYLSLGMKLQKIHRVLSFKQSAWLKSYVEFNTEKRKESKDDFEKDIFKLYVNSVYGKTMENLRNHSDVRLTTKQSQLKKYIASPAFTSFRV